MNHCCSEMAFHLQANEIGLEYLAKFRRYGFAVQDGGSSIQTIKFCPWCGERLPMNLREKWFDCLDQLGIDPYETDIPEEFKTDAWWIGKFDKDGLPITPKPVD